MAKGYVTPVVNRRPAPYRAQNDLARFHSKIEGVTHPYPPCEGLRGLPPLFPFHQSNDRTCSSTVTKSTPCCESTIHLQTSMSSPVFEPRPNGTAVNVSNHSTGWATIHLSKF
ncbi:hypothetical protein TNCV_3375231 [Trichonephila clavipes]|nr:hypothetical protein TNCV_3375231 [Trichonephila clavipes]